MYIHVRILCLFDCNTPKSRDVYYEYEFGKGRYTYAAGRFQAKISFSRNDLCVFFVDTCARVISSLTSTFKILGYFYIILK